MAAVYIVHSPLSVNGKSFDRGDVLRGPDAATFARIVASDDEHSRSFINAATPVAVDPAAPAPSGA